MPSPSGSPEALARLAGGPPRSLTPIGGGRNSRVFRLEAADGRVCALKAYFRHPGDARDRLGVEFAALSFLWEQGLRCVPQPLARDAEAGLGLYQFIPGDRPGTVIPADVDAACDFLAALKALARVPRAADLPPASEACFSLAAVAASVDQRLQRLAGADPARDNGLAEFLEGDLLPAWQALRAECAQRSGAGFTAELAPDRRTLSPSDFGFHNALRAEAGMVFLDFEYFGWDDPAKLLADFLLHPGMHLDTGLRRRFAQGALERLAVPDLAARTRLAFPLFGIKWCTILLNEFLPGPLERRAFADLRETGGRDRQARQLEKARTLLAQLLDDHAHFPYFPN